MSRHGDCTVEWGGVPRRFRLGWRELRRLEERPGGVGVYDLLRRLYDGTWRAGDIRDIIEIGLEGASKEPGGLKGSEGMLFLAGHVDAYPPIRSLPLAQRILEEGVLGHPEEPVGKKAVAAEKKEAVSSPMVASPSPPSTRGAPRSTSRRKNSKA